MVQEVETQAPVSSPEAPPSSDDQSPPVSPLSDVETPIGSAPAETPDAEQSTEERPESAPDTSVTDVDLDVLLSQYQNPEHPRHESFQRWEADRRAHAYVEAAENLRTEIEAEQARNERLEQVYTDVDQGLRSLQGRWDALMRSGEFTRDDIINLLRREPRVWNGLMAIGEDLRQRAVADAVTEAVDGTRLQTALDSTIFMIQAGAKAVNRPSIIQEFDKRIAEAKSGRTRVSPEWGTAIVQDYAKRLYQSGYEDGVKSGQKISGDQGVAESRSQARPAQLAGSSGAVTSDDVFRSGNLSEMKAAFRQKYGIDYPE